MMEFKIPINELDFSFSRSSGSGGQNVNKVNTKVTLRWNIQKSAVFQNKHDWAERFLRAYPQYVLDDGTVMITSQRFRNQARNIADCVEKLQEMVAAVEKPPKKRKTTTPTKASVEKRLKSKRAKSEIKKSRQKAPDY